MARQIFTRSLSHSKEKDQAQKTVLAVVFSLTRPNSHAQQGRQFPVREKRWFCPLSRVHIVDVAIAVCFVCFVCRLLNVPATCECISDNFRCCHTEIEVADPTFHLIQSQYTDNGPTSPSTDLITPGAWQGSHWSANFEVTGMTPPRKNHTASGIRAQDLPLSRRTP